MGILATVPEPTKVIVTGDNSAIVVQPPEQVMPVVVQSAAVIVATSTAQVIPVVVASGGPQGPPGSGGEGGDLHFLFNQGEPSSKWTIKHNLKKFPSVTVFNSAHEQEEGEVEHLNENELTVTFPAGAFSGVAYLN